MSDKQISQTKNADDIDLGDFLKLIIRIVKKIGHFLKNAFLTLYKVIISLFLFVKKNIVWLLAGTLVSTALGLVLFFTKGSIYTSTMTIKSDLNYNYFLYQQIEYYNSLIKNNPEQLSKELGISKQQATTIISFNIEPVDNDFESAKLYRNEVLNFRRNRFTADTIWVKTLTLKAFKRTLTEYSYPIQQITVKCRSKDAYHSLQNGIFNAINSNKELQKAKEYIEGLKQQEIKLLEQSLADLDTLKKIYNKKILLEAEKNTYSDGKLIIGQTTQSNPELELYREFFTIKDELMTLKEKSDMDQQIISLYSGFSNLGTKESDKKRIFSFSLWGFLGTFILFLLLDFYKYLLIEEKKSLSKI